MAAEEGLQRRSRQLVGSLDAERAQKFHEFLAGLHGKRVDGMSNDVGVNTIGQVETDSQTRADRRWDRYRAPWECRYRPRTEHLPVSMPIHMRRAGEGSRLRRRRECSAEQNPFGVHGTEAGMQTENGVELLDQILSQRD